jgi:hypothetical protein
MENKDLLEDALEHLKEKSAAAVSGNDDAQSWKISCHCLAFTT